MKKINWNNPFSLIIILLFTTYHTQGIIISRPGTGSAFILNLKSVPGDTIRDIDGNTYHSIKIGTQTWLLENLKTTKFNDGTLIPLVKDDETWGTFGTPAYCWYNNDSSANKNPYGALYNWYSAHTGKLCPKGWHVPSDAEWTVLANFLGGETTIMMGDDTPAGGKLKEADTTHWASPNTGANNISGFTALPAGNRGGGSGTFRVKGKFTGWWSSTEVRPSYAWYRTISFASSTINRDFGHVEATGFSIRCLKDK